jgi:hypothetical protein
MTCVCYGLLPRDRAPYKSCQEGVCEADLRLLFLIFQTFVL